MAKKGSSGSETKKNSKKNSNKAGLNRVIKKSHSAPPKDNPFETIWSRRKFDILGKKRKGEERRRKKTLLKEFEQSGKSSQFVDKRIGEQNDALSDFDKIVLRSQRERKVKSAKKYKYNLSDGEEDELDIGDGGFFSERDDFGEEVAPEDDDDMDGQGREKRRAIRERFTDNIVEEDENRFKSKKEVMLEIIQKSKHFKDLKRMEKEENEQNIEELDKDFKSLVQSEALVSLTHPGKMNALKALVNPGIPEEHFEKNRGSFSVKSAFTDQERPDAYDRLFNEMRLEARAKGSDRKKTDEEIAEEKKERLEELEQERQQRMLASPDDSDGDDVADDKLSLLKARPLSGDDLGDSFTPDEKQGKHIGWVDAVVGKDTDDSDDVESDDEDRSDEENEEETDEEDEGGDDKVETLKDWEQSDDDLVTDFASDKDEEDVDEDVNQEPHENLKMVNSRQQEMVSTAKSIKIQAVLCDSQKEKEDAKVSFAQQRELPYVIEAPNSMVDLCSLLENRSNKEIFEAIKRIRVSNAISLAAENRKKMQVFYGLLLQYFATVATKTPLNFELLNLLVKPLMEMSVEIPYFSAICARERLLRTRTQLCEDAKDPEKSCWPSLKTLMLLRLWSMTYPCSDFRHTVMTPAILLMCEYLMRCPILSGRDVAIGSFLCSMLLSVCKQSQKFCPEALIFLKSLLMTYLNKDPRTCQDSQAFSYLLELKASMSLCLKNCVDSINPLDFLHVMNLPVDSSYFSSDGFRASILASVVETLRGFVDTYKKLNGFPEIFMPILKLLAELSKQQNMEGPLLDKLNGLADLIKEATTENHAVRQPIQMTKKKPPMIKVLNPKYEDNFIKGRDYDPDRERAERRKLKKLLKEERKGAVRELKKDNAFLHELKEKEKAQREEERAEKYGKALAFLQEQEHAAKSGQLGKGRNKRRR
ncbi:hypothetical protein V2J09_016012 [Rumex salicifolius]